MAEQHLETGVRHIPGAAIVKLRGEVDGFAENALNSSYSAAEEAAAGAIVLDLTDVRYINSKGIALLVTLLIRAQHSGRQVRAYGLCDHFREILAITRLSDHIALYEDEESALAGIVPIERAAASSLGREKAGNDTGVPAPV